MLLALAWLAGHAARQPVSLVNASRCYDKRRYKLEKKRLREKLNQDDIQFDHAFSVFKSYTLGQDLDVLAHVKVPATDANSKPIRGEVTLPHQVGQVTKSRVLVFATGEHADEAKRLGADIVGGDELIQLILDDKITFDRCLSTKAMFPKVIKIARKLGPKGLMPSPAKGTVSDDLKAMMSSLQASTKFEPDADGLITMNVGKAQWKDADVEANIKAFVNAIVKVKPSKQDASRFIEAVSISAPNTIGLKLPNKRFVPKPPRVVNEVDALLATYGL
ncbi:ribosomal protein L1-like protein [Entophlyctis helioformis]|nr:ribosomal protein L1-like protein [Entophlyctis helioformis]